MRTHRKFTPEFKAQIVLEVISGQKTAAEACREYDIKAPMLSDWKTVFLRNAPKIFENPEKRKSEELVRIAELERLLGEKTLELDIAKKASSIFGSRMSRSGRQL